MKYGLNDEQWEAITASSPTLVNASAGSGKTRCLVAKIRLLLENGASPQSVLAITFTNKAANEMKSRLKDDHDIAGMQVSTIHSMCVRIIREFSKYTPLEVPFTIYDSDDQLSVIKTVLKARDLGGNPRDIQSDISRAKADRTTYELEGDSATVYKQYQEILVKNNACDFDDLLVYALDCLNYDDCQGRFQRLWKHILVDEVQDTSQIQYEIILRLYDSKKTETLFMVGDVNQCVVEGTNIHVGEGAVPVEDVRQGDTVLSGVGKRRTDLFPVKEVFSREVRDLPVVTVKTRGGFSVTTTREHIHFAGYEVHNRKRFFTYLMYKEGVGFRIGVSRQYRNRGQSVPFLGYTMRASQESADALWILGSFGTKEESRYHEQLYSLKYQIPTCLFSDILDRGLFQELDTERGAKRLLEDLGMFFDRPHHIPKCMTKRRRRNFSIRLCGDHRSSRRPLHHFSISGSDKNDEKILRDLGLNVRSAKSSGYRLESCYKDLGMIYSLVDTIKEHLDINVLERASLCDKPLPFTPASHVQPSMDCFVVVEGEVVTDEVVEVNHWKYTGRLYDLNVQRAHNYVANGIVTHNSIYGFRSARPENIQDFIERFNPTICNLTYNYRSCAQIIEHANDFLQYGNSMVSKSGEGGQVSLTMFRSMEEEAEKIAEALQKMRDFENTAILYRVNARSLQFERTFARYRIPYKVVGDLPFFRRRVVKDILAMLRAANNRADVESLSRIINVPKRGFGEAKIEKLMLQGREYAEQMAAEMPDVQSFLDLLDEVVGEKPYDAIQRLIDGTGYRATLTKDSDTFMLDALLDASSEYESVEDLILASSFLDKDSGRGVQLMTAHASKGLEFDRVFVVGMEDGTWPHKLSMDTQEENRLFYVACTRAKRYLNISCSKSKTFRGSSIECTPSSLFLRTYRKMFGKEMAS